MTGPPGTSVAKAWPLDERQALAAAVELQIAVRRADRSLHRWIPIWVVSADGQVYVRTWFRRDTGWFGDALRSGSARIRVPGLEADATVEDVGEGPAGLRELVDDAYRDKYGHGGSTSMIGDAAAATTLRLSPAVN